MNAPERPRRSSDAEALRTFFAVELDDRARRAVAALAERLAASGGGDRVRWVRPEAYHVTLRFLGSVPAERVPDLTERVRTRTRDLAPFELRLGTLRAFPDRRRPRVVVLDVEPSEPIAVLAAAVEQATVEAGFPAESRPYHAHVTLGRVRGRGAPALADAPDPVAFPVRSVVLFRSQLRPSGSVYTPLEQIALEGTGSP